MSDRITFPCGKIYITHDCFTQATTAVLAPSASANIRSVLEQFEGRVEDWRYSHLYDEAKGYPASGWTERS